MSMRRMLLGLVALLAVAACTHLPPVPVRGGPAWIELRSPHFVMWTDGGSRRGREILQQLEHFRSVLFAVAFPQMPPRGTTFVIAFGDIREARMFVPPFHDAFTVPPAQSPIGMPVMVLSTDGYGDERVVAHELAVALSFNAIHAQPPWLAEGFGTYFESIALDPKDKTVDVGRAPYALLHEVADLPIIVRGTPIAKRLFDWDCVDDKQCSVLSWVLISYLRNTHPKELAAFEQALATMPWREAWQASFPELPTERLDVELDSWLRNGVFAVGHYTIELQTWPVEQQALADADVYAVRAMLGGSKRDVAAAVGLDPNHVLARAVEARLEQKPPAVAAARSLAAAHPQSWVAWALFAAALQHGNEADLAKRIACDLAAENPSILAPEYCGAQRPL